jgi:hypothetical protein
MVVVVEERVVEDKGWRWGWREDTHSKALA